MVNFTTITAVKSYIDTPASDADINNILLDIDAEIIDETGLLPGTVTGNKAVLLKDWETLEACVRLKNRYPNAITFGIYRELHEPIPVWNERVQYIRNRIRGFVAGLWKRVPLGTSDQEDT